MPTFSNSSECEVCNKKVFWAAEVGHYFHRDGSNNDLCWLAIVRGTLETKGINGKAQALYRFFDADNVLLYIGISADLPKRIGKHRDEKPWWTEIARIAVEHFDDRFAVEAAEKRAIVAEQPRWNVVHNTPAKSRVAPPKKDRAVPNRAPSSSLRPVCLTDVAGHHNGPRSIASTPKVRERRGHGFCL